VRRQSTALVVRAGKWPLEILLGPETGIFLDSDSTLGLGRRRVSPLVAQPECGNFKLRHRHPVSLAPAFANAIKRHADGSSLPPGFGPLPCCWWDRGWYHLPIEVRWDPRTTRIPSLVRSQGHSS